MGKRTFTKDELEELGLPYTCHDVEIYDQGRWDTWKTGIFEHDGKSWQVHWSEGSTEMQDTQPWEYEDEIEATEVIKVPRIVSQWIPTDKAGEDTGSPGATWLLEQVQMLTDDMDDSEDPPFGVYPRCSWNYGSPVLLFKHETEDSPCVELVARTLR